MEKIYVIQKTLNLRHNSSRRSHCSVFIVITHTTNGGLLWRYPRRSQRGLHSLRLMLRKKLNYMKKYKQGLQAHLKQRRSQRKKQQSLRST
jgi:hypothetical protein